MVTLTLDTNCIINYFDTGSQTATSREDIEALIRYGTSGQARIALTTRVESDIDQDKDPERAARMKSVLSMFEVVGSVLRLDVSRWDSGDFWGDDANSALADEIQKILFPGLDKNDRRYSNKINDVDHLVGHILSKRDIFVTDDGRLNQKVKELAQYSAVVMRPAEAVAYVEKTQSQATPKDLIAVSAEGFANAGLNGKVAFDYSNNNGCFIIGQGRFLFETKWSKASDKAIYAYNDPPSINKVALAKGVAEIGSITDATAFDTSSRTRTVAIGEIAIWRNVNGLYAATKVLAIQDDTRGAPADELIFEYRILTEGRDFSR